MSSAPPIDNSAPASLPETLSESAWIEVIAKMDEVYNELLQYEVALEQKNAALEDSQQFIFSVLASMSDLLVVCDRHGIIEEVNQSLLDFTGTALKELKGAKLHTLFADTETKTLVNQVLSRLATAPTHDLELQLLTHSGETVPVALNFTPRRSNRGKLLGTVIIGRPVGELRRAYHALNEAHNQLKQTQQQLLQSEKMASLGRLVAGVAHELNNPISFVLGNVHAMQRYSTRLKHYLEAVHAGKNHETLTALRKELRIDRILEDLAPLLDGSIEGAERTRAIVDGLKRFSAADRQENVEFNLVDIIRRSVLWVTRAASPAFQVNLQLPERLPVIGSPGQIQQVMINLVQNAVDATENQPTPALTVQATFDNNYIQVIFHDNGAGISADALDKIFDPFYTTKPVGKGTGLGLSISYGIMESHGGKLFAENTDKGAKFIVRLPAAL